MTATAEPALSAIPPNPVGATMQPRPRRGAFAIVRSVLFWTHVGLGATGGVIILIMSLTGALLGFERQIVAAVDGMPRAVPPSATAARLPLDTLLGRSGIGLNTVASIALKASPTEPVSVRFRDRERAATLLDPYTASTIQPVPRGKAAAAMTWLRSWHRWLGVTGEHRPLARTFTGVANIAFLLLVLSGLYIWWPRRLNRAALRTAAVFNPRLRGKARDFNWHNSLGFWSAIPLALVVASGVFISYQWPGQWMDRLWGSETERAAAIKAMHAPPAGDREGRGEGGAPNAAGRARNGVDAAGSVASAPAAASLGEMLQAVEQATPAWQSITITPAGPRDSTVQLAVAEGNTYRPDLKTQYVFNARTGSVTRVAGFDSLSTSRKIRGWTRFGHTGEVFGVAGQAVATFVSFVGVVLVWTGLALAWRRLTAWMRRRRRAGLAA